MTQSKFDKEVEKNYKHNFRVNFLDGTFFWFGLSFIAAQTIIPAFVSNLTANPILIGLVTAISSGGWYIPQLFTANWVQSLPLKKYLPVNVGFFSERIPILLLPLSAWVVTKSPSLGLILFFIFFSWFHLGAGLIAVGWQDMIAKIIPTDRRGIFMGVTNFGGTFAGMVGAFFSVRVIDQLAFPYNFVASFSLAGILIFLSWIFLAMTKEAKQENVSPKVNQKDYRALLKRIFAKDKNFTSFILSRVLTSAGGAALGFIAVFSKFNLAVTDKMIASFTISMLAGQAFSNLLFGWLSDKKGHKFILELCNFAGILAVLIALLVQDARLLHISFVLMGVTNAGLILSGLAIIFEFSDPDVRPTYIGIANTINGVTYLATPLIGGWVAKSFGYPPLFVGASIIWLLGLILLRLKVKEPRGQLNVAVN